MSMTDDAWQTVAGRARWNGQHGQALSMARTLPNDEEDDDEMEDEDDDIDQDDEIDEDDEEDNNDEDEEDEEDKES